MKWQRIDMFARFFINRPIFATVASLIIFLSGAISIFVLPMSQYPDLLPPSVVVVADYRGASAEVISQGVAAPLETAINGVDDMIYINSNSDSSGNMVLNVYFAIGTDPDKALINVNNRVQGVMSTLPDAVRRTGVRVFKRSTTILEVLILTSPGGQMDPTEINNYALVNIVDDLKRIPGVGDARIVGSKDYSMRIWIKPDRMAQLGITVDDIVTAVNGQNEQFAAGKIGQQPVSVDNSNTYSLIVRGRLNEPAEFADIILRANPDGSALRLKEVADIELGAKMYEFNGRDNDLPGIPILIELASGANALSTADAVKAAMDRLSQHFPNDLRYRIAYDTTTFVRISIKEVVKTLLEAMLLVFLVVLLFLKSLRATLIPCLAVPVSIVGTFAGMQLFGFSINTLTLFGLVLAIGIVVDDAIIVIENTERIMRTYGLNAREATEKAMGEITSPIIAIVLVLSAVFIPVAFMQGLAGTMYKQFAMTITTSVIISGFVALTLTPALTALLLRPHSEAAAGGFLGKIFTKFDSLFQKITSKYLHFVTMGFDHIKICLLIIAVMLAVTVFLFGRVPGSLVPSEDQGTIMAVYSLDEGASLQRTERVYNQFAKIMNDDTRVRTVGGMIGFDMLGGFLRNSSGASFITLEDWSQRSGNENSSHMVAAQLMAKASVIDDARVLVFNPPPIVGMSATGGFEGYIQNRSDGGFQELYDQLNKVLRAAAQRPELRLVMTTFSFNTPQYLVDLDVAKAYALGVDTPTIYRTMRATFGDYYINDFNKLGRVFQVKMQSVPEFRITPENINEVYVRSKNGDMIPLSSLLSLKPIIGPDSVSRFNVFPAAKINGEPAPGYTSGQAIALMEQICSEVLDEGFTLDWIGSAYQEKQIPTSSAIAFVLGLIMVFLILAAQYERWTLPIAVICAVPFALFGAISIVWLRGMANDIYFQIALVTLVGLSAKNAILIVEFAHHIYLERGLSLRQAALEAARLRFRPIIMTSLAFVFGCLPLLLSSGAGAGSRHSIGTGVIGGMLSATIIAPIFVPLFFAGVIQGPKVIYRQALKFLSRKKSDENHG
jgi:hydrophobe/amphiphile efflux-1 (HAE1) family protein